MIKNVTKLIGLALIICFSNSNLDAKTLKASKELEKSFIKNALVAPTANTILFTSDAAKEKFNFPHPITYTKMAFTGFEKLQKKSFSDNFLGTTAIDPSKLPGYFWGSSFYDLQTNASMSERLTYYQTGGRHYIQNLWMCDVSGSTGWPQRSTHYEALDVTNPQDIYADGFFDNRIEKLNGSNVRTGWPAIVQFPNGSIGTASHDSTAPNSFRSIIWTNNSEFENDNFSSYLLSNSNPLWARTALDGNGNLHTIYTWTNNTNTLDKYGEIGYRKSTDKGKTWSNEIMFTGKNAFDGVQNSGIGADVYAIDAKENRIVVAYTDDQYNLTYRKSEDYGVTWSAPIIVINSYHKVYHNTGDLGGGRSSFISDTVLSPGSQVDVILDNNKIAHFVAPVFYTYLKGEGVLNGETIVSIDTVNTWTNGTLLYRSFAYTYENNTMGAELIANAIGDTTGGQLAANRDRVSRTFGTSLGTYPQFGCDDENNIYLTFSGLQRDDFKEVTITSGGQSTTFEGFYGHVYATWKSTTQPGTTWADTKLISYTTGADAIFTTMCNKVPVINGKKYMFIAYSANGTPGSFVTHTELPQEEEYIFTAAYPADSLKPLTITDVRENAKIDGSFYVEVMPNPASEIANIKINSDSYDRLTNLSINDMFGNKLLAFNENQINNFMTINLKEFASGLYSVNLTKNGTTITKLFTVIK